MKKFLFFIIVLFSFGNLFADGVSANMSIARRNYLNWKYGLAMKTGVESLQSMFEQIMSNMVVYVPELSSHVTINTNMHYEFSGADGFSEYSFHLAKTMTNENDISIISIINSPSEVERFHSLSISYEFLENPGSYQKNSFTRSGQTYEYIQDGNSAYLIFVFEKDDDTDEIKSGMLVRLMVQFKKNDSRAGKDKIIRSYLYEIMGKLKWKSLRAILN